MNAQVDATIVGLLSAARIEPGDIAAQEIRTGGNNRVLRVRTGDATYVAKYYFTDERDPRNRLAAEWGFLKFARRAGITCVPAPLACDAVGRVALYEYIAGEPVPREAVTEEDIDAARKFLAALNAPAARALATDLPAASEACFSIEAHFRLLEGRLQRLQVIPAEDASAHEAVTLVREMVAFWSELKAAITLRAKAMGLALSAPLEDAERCISPSDFGFHNALRLADGRLYFVDFEYAGWDDPSKTVADFFAHPANGVDERLYPTFADTAHAHLPPRRRGLFQARTRLLRPLFGLKWICILLNPFVPEWAARQMFANRDADLAQVRLDRLNRARRAMAAMRNAVVLEPVGSGCVDLSTRLQPH